MFLASEGKHEEQAREVSEWRGTRALCVLGIGGSSTASSSACDMDRTLKQRGNVWGSAFLELCVFFFMPMESVCPVEEFLPCPSCLLLPPFFPPNNIHCLASILPSQSAHCSDSID